MPSHGKISPAQRSCSCTPPARLSHPHHQQSTGEAWECLLVPHPRFCSSSPTFPTGCKAPELALTWRSVSVACHVPDSTMQHHVGMGLHTTQHPISANRVHPQPQDHAVPQEILHPMHKIQAGFPAIKAQSTAASLSMDPLGTFILLPVFKTSLKKKSSLALSSSDINPALLQSPPSKEMSPIRQGQDVPVGHRCPHSKQGVGPDGL